MPCCSWSAGRTPTAAGRSREWTERIQRRIQRLAHRTNVCIHCIDTQMVSQLLERLRMCVSLDTFLGALTVSRDPVTAARHPDPTRKGTKCASLLRTRPVR